MAKRCIWTIMQLADHNHARLIEHANRAASLSNDQFARCERAVAEASHHWDFNAPANALDHVLRDFRLLPDLETRRAVVARALLELPRKIRSMNLPPDVVALYPRAYDMVVRSLSEPRDHYDPDYYGKDVRFAFGHTVPAGAQFVDLYSRLGVKVIGRQITRPHGLMTALQYVRANGYRPWLQIHTDTRDVADFNEPGWDACYMRIAALLRRNPTWRGMIGNSWFYDPVLPGISPRLAYLQKPLQHGAFQVWTGSSRLDAERAAAKSPTRKALIEEGSYVPAAYTLAWPRAALLKWAESFDPC